MLVTLTWWPARRANRTGSRTAPKPQLTDEQWLRIADLFPHPPMTSAGGRPRIPPRPCLEGILWILRTGAQWSELPERFPSPSTCWRRLRDWTESGLFKRAWARLLGQLDGLRRIDWDEGIGDGTFSPAKKGGARSATPRRARAPRSC